MRLRPVPQRARVQQHRVQRQQRPVRHPAQARVPVRQVRPAHQPAQVQQRQHNMNPATEKRTIVATGGGLKVRGGGEISALTLDARAGDSSMILYDSTTASGTELWTLSATSGTSRTISFTKPIPFSTGLYLSMTPAGTGSRVCIALS